MLMHEHAVEAQPLAQLPRQHARRATLVDGGGEGTQEPAREAKRGDRDLLHNPIKASTGRNVRSAAYQDIACGDAQDYRIPTARSCRFEEFSGICRETRGTCGRSERQVGDIPHTALRGAVVSRPTGVCFQ